MHRKARRVVMIEELNERERERERESKIEREKQFKSKDLSFKRTLVQVQSTTSFSSS